MCWNQYVSFNTFAFGVFALLLIYFNNKYSPYKISMLNNEFDYIFFLSFLFMQFFEFLLWRNLDNKRLNSIISYFASLLLFIQPIASLFLLKNITERNKLLTIYLIPATLYMLYKTINGKFYTKVSKSGHLAWVWGELYGNKIISFIIHVFYLFFLYYALVKNKNYYAVLYSGFLLAITYYSFYKDGSAGSLWCWSVNIVFIFLIIQLLIYLPFQEYKSIC